MTEVINLAFLADKSEPGESVRLVIEPLGPLSMSSAGDNKYITTSHKPSKAKVYGMIENLLGLHLDPDTRKKILKDYRLAPDTTNKTAKSFIPILHHHIRIDRISVEGGYSVFADFGANLWRRKNELSHLKGAKLISSDLDAKLYAMYLDCFKGVMRNKDVPFNKVAEQHCFERAPRYYSTVIKREYVVFDSGAHIVCEIATNAYLKDLLTNTLNTKRSSTYLGNSESIVNVTIEEV